MDNRRILIEQYDDAVFALLMDEHAETEGAELLSQFQAAVEVGLVPEFPRELDQTCTQTIEAEFRARRGRAVLKGLLKGVIRVVLAVFMLLGFLGRVAAECWQEHRARYDLQKTPPEPAELPGDSLEDVSHPIFLTV